MLPVTCCGEFYFERHSNEKDCNCRFVGGFHLGCSAGSFGKMMMPVQKKVTDKDLKTIVSWVPSLK